MLIPMALGQPLPPGAVQPPKTVILASPKAAGTVTTPMRKALVVVRPPNTNRFSLDFSWILPAGFTITNTTVFTSNQTASVTDTNFGTGTNGTLRWLSPTNRYQIWATCTDSNGISSLPSNIVEWRPPLTCFLTVSTIPSGPSVCVTNPVGSAFFRLWWVGTTAQFQSAPTPQGPWQNFRQPITATAPSSFKVKATLTNDFSVVLASERRE
jgi:hypothetical protein